MKLENNLYKTVVEAKLRTLGDLHVRDNFDITIEVIRMLRLHVVDDLANWGHCIDFNFFPTTDEFTNYVHLAHKQTEIDILQIAYGGESICEREGFPRIEILDLLDTFEKALEAGDDVGHIFQARISSLDTSVSVIISSKMMGMQLSVWSSKERAHEDDERRVYSHVYMAEFLSHIKKDYPVLLQGYSSSELVSEPPREPRRFTITPVPGKKEEPKIDDAWYPANGEVVVCTL